MRRLKKPEPLKNYSSAILDRNGKVVAYFGSLKLAAQAIDALRAVEPRLYLSVMKHSKILFETYHTNGRLFTLKDSRGYWVSTKGERSDDFGRARIFNLIEAAELMESGDLGLFPTLNPL